MRKWLVGLILCITLPVGARELAGVPLSEQVDVAGQVLILNGAGVRSRFFIKVYVGALYLPASARSTDTVYAQSGPKRVVMHFVYDEVSRDKLVGAWNDGFENNLTPERLAALRPRLEQFNALFRGVRAGEQIVLDLLPGIGTEVRIAGELRGTIPGDDFQPALLSVWLGGEPADADLKEGMLGGE